MKPEVSNLKETRPGKPDNLDTDLKDALHILPIRSMVAFPQMSVPYMISFSSASVIEKALKADRMIGLLTVKDPDVEHPVPGQLYEVGTLAKVVHAKKNEEGVMVALLNGISRFRVTTWQSDGTNLRASVVNAPEIVETGIEEGGRVVIVSGLTAGERVVTTGAAANPLATEPFIAAPPYPTVFMWARTITTVSGVFRLMCSIRW